MTGDGDLERLRRENAELRARLGQGDEVRGAHAAAFLESILAAVPAFVARFDADRRIRYMNRIQPGLKIEDVIGSSVFSFVHPDDVALARTTIDRVLETGQPEHYDSVATGPNGGLAFYECYVSPVLEGDRSGGCLMAFEVTTHRSRQLALEESQRQLRLALDAGGVGLWTWDLVTGQVFWDERMKAMMGRETTNDYSTYVSEFVHPDDRARMNAVGRYVLETGNWAAEIHRIVRPDGTVRWMMSSGDVVSEGGHVVRILGCNIDITEHRELEEQMRHAQKLEATGSLTAGIAHNFNNLLAAILPALELIAPVAPEGLRDVVTEAMHASRRAAELVSELMTFAGQRRSSSRRPEPIGALVERAVGICRSTFDRRISLDVRVPSVPLLVECEGGAVEQVLVNLMLNARDALRGSYDRRARVVVEVPVVEPATDDGGSEPPMICLRVTDNGVGMSEEIRRRIFEPFFTTKPVGQGTGLGLSTSYAIVREHGGTIECDSEPGRGTRMSVYLPLHGVRGRVRPQTPIALASVSAAHVLLVEDEGAIRKVVRRLLESVGHRVTAVGGTREAVAWLGESKARRAKADPPAQPDDSEVSDVALVLLDRSMPDGLGETIIPDLRRHLPNAHILLFTGQDVDPEVAALADGVLAKPVTSEDLLRAVEGALKARK